MKSERNNEVPIIIGNVRTYAVLDSGADHNCISADLYRVIKNLAGIRDELVPINSDHGHSYYGADGKSMKCLGEVTLSMEQETLQATFKRATKRPTDFKHQQPQATLRKHIESAIIKSLGFSKIPTIPVKSIHTNFVKNDIMPCRGDERSLAFNVGNFSSDAGVQAFDEEEDYFKECHETLRNEDEIENEQKNEAAEEDVIVTGYVEHNGPHEMEYTTEDEAEELRTSNLDQKEIDKILQARRNRKQQQLLEQSKQTTTHPSTTKSPTKLTPRVIVSKKQKKRND
jgi:hypothetical protein